MLGVQEGFNYYLGEILTLIRQRQPSNDLLWLVFADSLATFLSPTSFSCEYNRCTCQDGISHTCGVNGYDCLDPDAPTDCDTASPTPSPAAAFGYPDCTGYMYYIQDGKCDSSLNNEECGEVQRLIVWHGLPRKTS